MGSNDKQSEWNRLAKGFSLAFSGLWHTIRTEKNLRIHFIVAIIVIFCAAFFQVTTVEICILFIVIGIVISLELVNTAIERTVDLVTEKKHPLAKLAKDTASAAVFFFSIIAVVVGLILFIPYITAYFH